MKLLDTFDEAQRDHIGTPTFQSAFRGGSLPTYPGRRAASASFGQTDARLDAAVEALAKGFCADALPEKVGPLELGKWHRSFCKPAGGSDEAGQASIRIVFQIPQVCGKTPKWFCHSLCIEKVQETIGLHPSPEGTRGKARKIGLDLHRSGLEVFLEQGQAEVMMIDYIGSLGGPEHDKNGRLENEIDQLPRPLFQFPQAPQRSAVVRRIS